MDFKTVNPLNVRLNMISGNLLPMSVNDSYSLSWKMYGVLMWSLQFIQLITLILGCLSVPKEKVMKDGMVALIVTSEIIFMSMQIYVRRKLMYQIIQNLNEGLCNQDEIMKTAVTTIFKPVAFALKLYMIAGTAAVIMWTGLPFMLIFQRDSFVYEDFRLPVVLSKEPFSVNIYLFGCIMIMICAIYCFVKKVSIDTYIIHIISLLTVQYQYFATKLAEVFQHKISQNKNSSFSENESHAETFDHMEQQIKILCRYYTFILRTGLMIKDLLSLNFVVLYGNNIFRFCFIAFMVLSIPSTTLFEGLLIISYSCGSIIQLYILCFCVQMLMDASGEITDKAFHKDWYQFGFSMKRTFLLLIMANDLECKVSKFKKCNLTLSSFMAILNQSYSIAILISKTR